MTGVVLGVFAEGQSESCIYGADHAGTRSARRDRIRPAPDAQASG
jgi:hypothetical protein